MFNNNIYILKQFKIIHFFSSQFYMNLQMPLLLKYKQTVLGLFCTVHSVKNYLYYLLQSALWDSLEWDVHSLVIVMELHATQWLGSAFVPLGRQENTVRKV